MSHNIELLKKLSEAFGPSGYEDDVRAIIIENLKRLDTNYKIDNLGNIIISITKEKSYPTVILDAHMDEVGFLITQIDKNGFLRFEILGGIDTRILLSQKVKIKGKDNFIYGIIGAKAPHLLLPEEKSKVPHYRTLFIDIGAKSRKDALEMGVHEGSVAVFDSQFIKQNNRILGKAFDDRIGCYLLLELLEKTTDLPLNILGVFSTQEEVGLRGARALSLLMDANYAIALECTAAADTPGVPEHDVSTKLENGPAITIADRATISNPKLVRRIIRIAEENNIPYQFKGRMVGGTDASAYQYVRYGIPSVTISVPSRYIHSACSIASLSDIENTEKLVYSLLEDIAKNG